MNLELIRAIREKRLVELTYKSDQVRIVEPHDYGIRNGTERLLAFQVNGESRTSQERGWKDFHLEHVRDMRVLEKQFRGSRRDDSQTHLKWDVLFARVDE